MKYRESPPESANALELEKRPTEEYGFSLFKAFLKYKIGLLGLGIVGAVVILGLFPMYIAPHDPFVQNTAQRLLPPFFLEGGGSSHLLGTDHLGRDYFSRIIYGARISLAVGFFTVLISSTIGITLGLLGGYFGGLWDRIVNLLVDMFMTFPFILLAMVVIALLGPSFTNMILVLGITTWPVYTKVVRSKTLVLRESEYIQASIVLGSGSFRVIAQHVFPNLLNVVIVLGTLEVARAIIAESFLSFLGLGIQPPTPAWGAMLSDGRNYLLRAWWLATFPGLSIFMATLGINLLGDTLRDILDPQLTHLGKE